jgi:hypothetical protein
MSLPQHPRRNNHARSKRRGRGRGNAGSGWSRRSQRMESGVWQELSRQNGAVILLFCFLLTRKKI